MKTKQRELQIGSKVRFINPRRSTVEVGCIGFVYSIADKTSSGLS